MLCEKCNKNQATFHYAEVINGVRSEHHLCGECAANTDVSFYSSIFENDENFTRLISGILGGKAIVSGNGESDKSVNVTCPTARQHTANLLRIQGSDALYVTIYSDFLYLTR